MLVVFMPAMGFAADAPAPLPPDGPAPLAPGGPAPRAGDVLRLDGQVQTESDPVVASIEGHQIHLSELGKASDLLPDRLRAMPFASLYPALLERMIDHQALVAMARRNGLDENPAVKREIDAAVEHVLEGEYLRQATVSAVTEGAIRDRYAQEYGNRPATEQVRARHILVATEAEAYAVIAQLKSGADFASLAANVSKDPDRKQGGDLGFFRRAQVWPAFADVAFSLQPGQVGPHPVHNEFGWHVIKVEERRLVAPPSLEEAREGIRRELTTEAIREAVKQARAQLQIHEFNIDGSVRLGAGPSNTAVTPR